MKRQIKDLLKKASFISAAAFMPFVASAQATNGLSGVITKISNLFGEIVPVLVGLGVIYFVWGVIQYFIADSEEAKTKGKDRIIFGIIGLAVIISVWGLVAILNQTLGLGGSTGLDIVNTPTNVGTLVTQTTDTSCDIGPKPKLQNLMNYVTCIIGKSVIPLLFALAIVMFVWGAVKFFFINGGEPEEITKGKQFMLWGIVALAVMISVWGLVNILGDTFGFSTGVLPTYTPAGR